MGDLYHCIGGTLLSFGVLSFCSGVIAFFPVFSYKPWFIGWSVRIAAPLWNGVLAIFVGVCVLVANRERSRRSMWEVSYTFAILTTMCSPVQFALAIASLLIGPYCYYAFAGAVGSAYVGYAVQFPFPYGTFPDICQDPQFYQWYHFALQLLDIISGIILFGFSLCFVIILTLRLHQAGNLNKPMRVW
uniref:Transmembrane protein 212 n=1 Tax=Erpetoichthys calabaricus TaxID=27687 RepID=A0A8C4S0R9_ERPCA